MQGRSFFHKIFFDSHLIPFPATSIVGENPTFVIAMGLFGKITGGKASDTLLDEELLSRYSLEKDPILIGELFKRYSHLVMGVCMKYLRDEEDARDAVMQVFEQLLTKPPETKVDNVKAWLYTVTKNHCLMALRHEKAEQRMREGKGRELMEELMESPSGVHLTVEDENPVPDHRLYEALQKLSSEQQACVRMFYLEDRSYKDICELTGFDFAQVKSYIQNGKRNLKNLLDHGARSKI